MTVRIISESCLSLQISQLSLVNCSQSSRKVQQSSMKQLCHQVTQVVTVIVHLNIKYIWEIYSKNSLTKG